MPAKKKLEKATFGAGCFWGVEERFREVKGVVDVISGYTGGSLDHPTYEDVCTGTTGHAEAVEVTFDPSIVSYKDLLELFWSIHDPTQVNRQGLDIGSNYRSVIFYHSEAQKKAAMESKKELEKRINKKVATEITPASTFWKAEEYHQKYLQKHGRHVC